MSGRPAEGREWRLAVAALAALAAGSTLVAHAAWIHIKAAAAQCLIAAAWERAHTVPQDAAPWPWADTRPVAKLTWGEGPHATTLVVLEGSSGRNLAFGPVHDPASVLPGDRGNSVIEGHRDTHFRILRNARPGDAVRIETADGRTIRYRITNVQVVDSRDARILLQSELSRLTLVTCYPFDALNPGGPLRWVVTAESTVPDNEAKRR